MDVESIINKLENNWQTLRFIKHYRIKDRVNFLFQVEENKKGVLHEEFWFVFNQDKQLMAFEYYGKKHEQYLIQFKEAEEGRLFCDYWERLSKKSTIRLRLLFI